jgi:hypothetical protein
MKCFDWPGCDRRPELMNRAEPIPTTEADWLALAARLADDGHRDEAAVVRVFWPAIADTIATGVTEADALSQVRRHAARLGRLARTAEERNLDR